MKHKRSLVVVTLAVIIIFSVAFTNTFLYSIKNVRGESSLDWPMYMHDPFHTGISSSQISPPFLKRYTIQLEEPTDSSPIIVKGKLYIGDKGGNTYCFDAYSGKLIWKRNVTNGNAIDSSLCFYNGRLFFGDANGDFICEDALNGNVEWEFQTGGSIVSSPLVVSKNGTLYVVFGGGDRTVYCLNADKGEVLWQYTTNDSVFSSPALFKDSVVIGSFDGNLYRFRLDDGTILWKTPLKNNLNGVSDKIYASPSVDTDTNTIFIGSYNHYLYSINGDTGDIKWTLDLGEVIYSTTAVYGNTLICGTKNKVVAIDKSTGNEKWDFGCSGLLFSSPTVEGGFILVEEKSGEFSCLAIQNGERVWNFDAENGSKSTPIAYENNIYFVGGNIIYVFSDKQHSEKPILFSSTDKLHFGKIKKGETVSKYITLKNVRRDVMTGDIIGMLSGTITTDANWITISPLQFKANVQVVTVTVDTSKLKEGESYLGKIFIKTNGGNVTVKVYVSVEINPDPILSTTIDKIERSIKCGEDNIKVQFYIVNAHKDSISGKWIGTLKGDISSNSGWVKISPTSFMSNKQLVNLVIDTSQFKKGKDYNSVIDIKSNGGNKSIQIIIHCLSPEPQTKTIITLQPNNPMMTVNGVQQEIDPGRGTKPVIIAKWGRTVVPIRAIVEALGGTIGWDGTERKVTINFKDTVIELWIGKPQARVNGEMKWIDPNNHDVKPIIVNGRTMLPLRFVAENLGCSVDWDPATKTITIVFVE